MIMCRQPDGTYAEIGSIRTKNGDEIEKIVDRDGNVYFEKYFKQTVSGVPCVLENSAGKPVVDYKIYGNSVQDGTPSPESPVEVQSVGQLVTEGEFSGKYAIPIISVSSTEEKTTTVVYLDEPLRKIGDYADRIDFKEKCVVRNCSAIDLGSLRYNAAEGNRFVATIPDIAKISIRRLPMYCDVYGVLTNGETFSENFNNVIYNGGFATNVYVHDYRFTSASELKNSLSNTFLYYPLANSITTPIALPEIPAFSGTTIIETDTEIQPSDIEITYQSRRTNS